MNKRKLCALIAVPGLAVTSLLLAFLLLGQSTVGAASDRPAAITDIQSLNTDFIISDTVFAANGAKAGGSLDVCGDVWIIETVDSAGNVGGQTSLALEPTYPYTPHISHHANPSGDPSDDLFLKHAWLSSTTWLSETVDFACGKTSLALVPTSPYTPAISYDGCNGRVKFAWLEGTTWISKTVPAPATTDPSLALEPTPPYTPHISYFWEWGTARNLNYATLSGTTWVSSTLVYEAIEPPYAQAGWHSSLALELTYPYAPHISYFHRNNPGDRDLKYAWLNGTAWLSETVDSAGDVGLFPSLALDSDGNPHVSYFDDTNDAVKYAWLSGTTWFSETVESTGQPFNSRGHSSLALDQSDLPYISYYNATDGDLKLAYSNGTVWITQIVDNEGDVGQYSSLALDQAGCPHISYYDVTNGDLKYAYLRRVNYLPVIFKNY